MASSLRKCRKTMEQIKTKIPYQNYPMSMIHGWRVTNVLCEDGKRRTVTTTGTPDTFFSQPARITVRKNREKKTVTGFITMEDEEYKFIANKNGKNHDWFLK